MTTAKHIVFTSAAHGDHTMAGVLDTLTRARHDALAIAAMGSVLGTDGFDSFAEMTEDRQMAIFNNITELADRAAAALLRLDDMLSMADVKEAEGDHD